MAEINLRDNLSRPLKEAETGVKKFAERSRDELGRFTADSTRKWAEFGDKLGAVSQKLQTTGLALSAGITAPLLLMGRTAVKAASDLNESFTKTQQVFGQSSRVIEEFSKTSAKAMGLSRQAALDYASSFGLILQAGGKTESQSADMSKTLSTLAADLASFYNVDVQTAADKLKSGLVGEAEPLRAFGVLLSETAVKARALAMGFKEEGGQLSEAAKVQARYAIILDQTRKAQGDFGRTSDGLANQSRILKANLADLSADIGDLLLPYVKQGVTLVGEFIQKFKDASPEMKKTALVVAGVAASIGPLLLVMGTVGNAVSGLLAGQAALKALALTVTNLGGVSAVAAGIISKAFALITGPIGIAVAVVAALYVAWQKNIFGIQEIVKPFVSRISTMFKELWSNIQSTMKAVVEGITSWWKKVEPSVRPVLMAITKFVQDNITSHLRVVEWVYQKITDYMNSALALIQFISGKGWNDISDSMKASLLRMRSWAVTIMANIAQAVLNAFRAITSIASLIPGLGGLYDAAMAKAQGWIDSLKAEAAAGDAVAGVYDKMAASKRKAQESASKSPKVPGSGGGSPGVPGVTGTGGGKVAEAQARELTAAILLAMGKTVKAGSSDPWCANFASAVIAKFTDGVTDKGGKIIANAKALRDRLFALGAEGVTADKAKPGALAYRKGSGPSGVHVGIVLGNGQVMDMNGRAGKNKRGLSSMKDWSGFANIPDKFLQKEFKGGDLNPQVQKALEEYTAEQERLASKLADVQAIQRSLTVEQMKARGENIKDIISVREFGKAYAELEANKLGAKASQDAILNKAKVDALAATEVWEKEQEALTKSREATMAKINAQAALNRQAGETAKAYERERDLIKATTEAEKVKWEITKGQYKDAGALSKVFLLAQAMALDSAKAEVASSKAAKDAREKVSAAWEKVVEKAKDFTSKQRESAQERYDEYIERITQRLLELKGAQDEILKRSLVEQFSGFGAGLTGWKKVWAIASKVGEVMKQNRIATEAERQAEIIKGFARSMEKTFTDAIDNIFENGFKGFFSDVIGGFRNMLREMAAGFLKLQIQRALIWGIGQLGGAGAGKEFAAALTGKAVGGSVFGSKPYMVGETGPELFIPSGNGRIVPNYALEGGGGNTITNVYVTTPDRLSFRKSDGQIMGAIAARSNRARMRNGKG